MNWLRSFQINSQGLVHSPDEYTIWLHHDVHPIIQHPPSTTFNSPFRQYHFLHLPFGLVCLQDIFQKKMDQIPEKCQGCMGITDDITFHGCTKAEHDAHLRNLMHVTREYGLVFNPQKTAVNFFGCLYDADGVHLDLDKVNTIHSLPAPTDVTKLHEFLGMVMYLSPFILGLSTLTTPLCELLKKDTDFIWNCTYDAAFQCVKTAVISDTTLQYFDPLLPMTIQVDASQVGLGAALLQNNKPIAFTSKTLTKTEHHYAQHRKRDACHHLWSWEVQNVHLQ